MNNFLYSKNRKLNRMSKIVMAAIMKEADIEVEYRQDLEKEEYHISGSEYEKMIGVADNLSKNLANTSCDEYKLIALLKLKSLKNYINTNTIKLM